MNELFTALDSAIRGSVPLAIGASLLWGILSVVLSPCHLGSLPLIVGFISGQGSITTRRAFSLSLLFGSGVLITIGLIGVITALFGRMLGDVGVYGNYFVAAVFFIVGLYLLEIIPQFSPNAPSVKMRKRGGIAAFLLGLIFGIALGPCTFAYMMPMLAITYQAGVENFLWGSFLLLLYGIGHTAVIVVAGTSATTVQKLLNWNEHSKGLLWLKRVCGVLVILAGIYMIYTQ